MLCTRQLGLLAVDLVAAHKPGIPLNRIWKPVEVRRILSTTGVNEVTRHHLADRLDLVREILNRSPYKFPPSFPETTSAVFNGRHA